MAHAALELCLTLVLGPVLGTICVPRRRKQHNEHGVRWTPASPRKMRRGLNGELEREGSSVPSISAAAQEFY